MTWFSVFGAGGGIRTHAGLRQQDLIAARARFNLARVPAPFVLARAPPQALLCIASF